MKKLVICILAGVLLLSGPVAAECLIAGTLVRVDILDETRKDKHTLYVRESQLDPHVYSFDTSNEIIAVASMALVLSFKVEIQGDEFSCPSFGQDRFGGILERLIVNP